MFALQPGAAGAAMSTLAARLDTPRAVIVLSPHWETRVPTVGTATKLDTIHDFGGFPKELFAVEYPAPGNPQLAEETAGLITSTSVGLDHDWGLDHGTWTIVRHMYPEADVPVLQLSIDYAKPASYHYALAQQLRALRKKGVLIIGSGNMVHNLGMIAWDHLNDNYGFDWALEMNDIFKKKILEKDHTALMNYQSLSACSKIGRSNTRPLLSIDLFLGTARRERCGTILQRHGNGRVLNNDFGAHRITFYE